MKKAKKVRWIIIAAILFGIAVYALYLCLNYFFYMDYRKYLGSYTVEAGKEFVRLDDSDPAVEGMVPVAENDILKLYTNTTTTEVAVYDKRSGEVTYSNPLMRGSDPLANGRNLIDLNSQFMLTYYDSSMTEVTMYNYDYSVERNQFTLESIDDGIRYTYLLGNLDSPTGLVPPLITEARLQEKILSKLTEKEARTVRNNYVESTAADGFLELPSGILASKVALSKLQKLVEQAGYTQADFDEDAASAAGGEVKERTTFTIPLEYRLEGDKLAVSVPAREIKETGSGRLARIDLLSYFGAGDAMEEGYLLVPNGTGSLIYFNNHKKTERYNQYIYGMDELIQSYTVVENTEKARLPVYGIKHRKSAVLAEITQGDTLANLIAQVAGNTNSYNYVYPSFLIRGSEEVSMFGVEGVSADLPTLEKDIYDVKLTVTYAFLEEKDASYTGMASYYRKDLAARGGLGQKEASREIPFYLDIIGGVTMEQSILGIPYHSVYPMTTFEEAGTIIDEFAANNITNLRVNYLGWFGGGYYHDVAKKLKVERKLGGRRELEALNEKLTELGGKLYGDVAFQKVSFEADNFNYKMESAMYYSGYPVMFGAVNPAVMRQTNSMGYEGNLYNIVSPKFLVRHVSEFVDAADKANISGISLRDLGDILSSDKKRTNIINRQQAKEVVLGQLEAIRGAADHLMISGGNGYSLAYATDLENVPAGHNPYYIVDEEIPFYQMVVHGSIDYTSGAVNLSDSYDKQEIILRMIEYGSSPRFTLSYEESSKMKYSALNVLYTTQYHTWLADAADIYHKTNEVLKNVENSAITGHEILGSGIRMVTYDNGTVIYINYNNTETTVDGKTIPAKSYRVEEAAK